jgi:LacI family repressor for deo operon, udp, cdd, tsx, nupC, and nupG
MDELDPTAPAPEANGVRAARIGDVARLAKVSTATVSRALATPDRVSPETRARVAAAVASMGYVPNPAARSLRSQKSRMVLVVLPDLANIFFSQILRGIEETLFDAGYGMIIGNLDGPPEKEARFAALAAMGQVDGALLLNGRLFGETREGRGPGSRTGAPVVALCEAIPADIPQIEVDNRAAAADMTRHLAGLGHRRVAYVTGPAGNVLERERFAGYRDGLAAEGLPFDPTLVHSGDYTLEAGARIGAALAGVAAAERPTAVFSSNDAMAIGLMRALAERGVRVPGDVSVAGFDDIEYAAVAEPALTTVRQPRRDLGRAGAAILLDLLAGRPAPALTRLDTELVVRASTRAPRGTG